MDSSAKEACMALLGLQTARPANRSDQLESTVLIDCDAALENRAFRQTQSGLEAIMICGSIDVSLARASPSLTTG